jgi:hypothetical protein
MVAMAIKRMACFSRGCWATTWVDKGDIMNNTELSAPDLTYTLPEVAYVMPQAIQDYVLYIFGGGTVLLVMYALYVSFKKSSALPFLFLFGGLFSIMLEPLADVMGNVIHAPVGQIFAFQAEGHPVPWHVVLGYVWYYGLLNICLFDKFRAGTMTPLLWWKATFWAFVSVTLVEQVPILFGVWVYYGEHPFHIGVMPLAMISANFASVIVSGLVVYRVMPILKGWRQLLVLPLVPATVIGSHTGASIPSYIALGQNTAEIPFWILQAGSLLTFGFSIMLVWVTINIVHNRFPAVGTVDERDTVSDYNGSAVRRMHT